MEASSCEIQLNMQPEAKPKFQLTTEHQYQQNATNQDLQQDIVANICLNILLGNIDYLLYPIYLTHTFA